MARWLEPGEVSIPAELQEAFDGHRLLLRGLVSRGLCTPAAIRAFLDPSAYTPAQPDELPGLRNAADRLQGAIQEGQRIAVWGDFDADGQTATALLLELLRSLGADVVYRLPTRQEGHGLHEAGVEQLVSEGVSLIVTCDTGVTAHSAIAHARALGADVIVTDHHVPPAHLPAAVAVVNPHFLPVGHPMSALTGVGVAYQLARHLAPERTHESLDLVALGMVADVATVAGDTRYLIQRGIQALRHTSRIGLRSLCEVAELQPEGITEEHLGFVLGPRLNTLGRLADASLGVELLTTGDPAFARRLALEAEALNSRRQWLTKQVTDAALAMLQREPQLLDDFHALVLSHPSWPTGILGIVAGRLAERFRKPAVLISTPAGKPATGSARSSPGIDLMAALSKCGHLLRSHGGHAAAAGLSIDPDRIVEFRSCLSRAVGTQAMRLPEHTLQIDAYVEISEVDAGLAVAIGQLAPFGPGNPPLTLALRSVRSVSEASIGRSGEHRRVIVEDRAGRTQPVFWWQGAGWPLPEGRFDLAFTLRASDYRGVANVQVEWIEARPIEPGTAVAALRPRLEVADHRASASPHAALRALALQSDLQVWAEGHAPPGVECRTRSQLVPGQTLAIWTLPPGPQEFSACMARVRPQVLHLFAQDPGLREEGSFLRRLASLAKHAIAAKQGRFPLEEAAAAMAHRIQTVEAGLELLSALGIIGCAQEGTVAWQISAGSNQEDPEAAVLCRKKLEALLAETSAYREYVRQTPVEALFAGLDWDVVASQTAIAG